MTNSVTLANVFLNQARDKYGETIKVSQRIAKALGITKSEAEAFEGAILSQEAARVAYEKAKEDAAS